MQPFVYTPEGRLFEWLTGERRVSFAMHLLDERRITLSLGVGSGLVFRLAERVVQIRGEPTLLSPYFLDGEVVYSTLWRFPGHEPLRVPRQGVETVRGKRPEWDGRLTLRYLL